MLPVSELARAKMKMTLGQLLDLPFSSSLRVLVPSWRARRVAASGEARVMGEAAARLASMERARNFMVIDVEYDDTAEIRLTEAGVLPWG
jgi:hypothetical protein